MTDAEKLAILVRANEAGAFGTTTRPHTQAGFWTTSYDERQDPRGQKDDEDCVLAVLEKAEEILGCRVDGALAVDLFGKIVYAAVCHEGTRAWGALKRLGRRPRSRSKP